MVSGRKPSLPWTTFPSALSALASEFRKMTSENGEPTWLIWSFVTITVGNEKKRKKKEYCLVNDRCRKWQLALALFSVLYPFDDEWGGRTLICWWQSTQALCHGPTFFLPFLVCCVFEVIHSSESSGKMKGSPAQQACQLRPGLIYEKLPFHWKRSIFDQFWRKTSFALFKIRLFFRTYSLTVRYCRNKYLVLS